MKIAVIGAGISGLTAASILHRKHDVTVFEAGGYVGGHTNTVPVKEGSRTLAVDTGFIVFNEPNYPNLCRLFDRHDVAVQDSDMSFSVHEEGGGLEYNGTSMDKLFAQRTNLLRPRFWGMLSAIARFHREAPVHLADGLDDTVTVSQYAQLHRYDQSFVDHYLVPLGASLWSCESSRFREFPMRFVLEFLSNHHMLQVNGRPPWKTVKGGSCQYVSRLTAEFEDRIVLNAPVERAERGARGVDVELKDGRRQSFDEVVFATHADQSLRMVQTLDAREKELLGMFPYQTNEVVLHTDTDVLPQREKTWASWNYRIPSTKRDSVTVTYNMNKLQSLDSQETYCVSLNQSDSVDEASVIRRIRYQHPTFLPGRASAQAEHGALIRHGGVSYCGAYWGYGFHEDGVRSALAVCEAFDMDLDT